MMKYLDVGKRKLLNIDRTITMKDRVKNYLRDFPESHLCIINEHIEGLWIMGSSYSVGYSKDWYGSYPFSYIERIMALFPDLEPFHLFSGYVNEKLTLDINSKSKAKIRADAQNLPLRNGSIELFIADPPYDEKYAKEYGFSMISRNKVIEECYHALKPLGFLVWLDLLYPQFVFKEDYKYELYGIIGLVISTLHRIRQITILQKVI
jgi:hypothetical protein